MHWLAVLVPIAFGLIAVAAASSARAQVDEEIHVSRPISLERLTLGGFLGGDFLSDDVELGNSYFDDQVPTSGFLFGLRAGYDILPHIAPGTSVDPRLAVELEGALTLTSTEGTMERESISTPVLGWRANVALDLWQRAPVIPFFLVGGGGKTVFGENRFMDSPDSDVAAHLGVGAKVPLGDRLGLRGDLRLGMQPGRFEDWAPSFEFHLGAYYAFGRGAPAQEPLEVSEPEEPVDPGPSDSDGDGIDDDRDRCPKEPELVNDIDDDDGCPEVDSDGDKLLGSLDSCPAEAEDFDNFEDEDGCPDLDNDQDGVPDSSDACPGVPETKNGYKDDDGCPDEVPAEVQKFTGTIQGIRFRTGSARIRSSSKRTLDGAVEILRQYPDLRIEISGHTDNVGPDEANRLLARKRADYVKWYLVDHGIDSDRIETVGYGPDRPVANNSTREGRAQNRRIEFRLLSGAGKAEPAEGKATGEPSPADGEAADE